MRRALLLSLALVAALLAIVGSAQAAGGRIAVYEVSDLTISNAGIAWGQVLDAKPSCTSDRGFKLTMRREQGGETQLLDKGRSSSEGAISGLFLVREVRDGYDVRFAAPATRGCPALRQSVPSLDGDDDPRKTLGQAASRSRFIEADIGLVKSNGADDDGALGGAIFLSRRGDCYGDREVKLLGDGKLLDKGTTTQNGAWALHLTWAEHETVERYRIKLSKETRGEDRCGAASLAFGPDAL